MGPAHERLRRTLTFILQSSSGHNGCPDNPNDMTTTTPITLAAHGRPLDRSEDALGWLRPSDDVAGDSEALRARLAEDGYLYVPGALDREAVRAGRLELLRHVEAHGALDPAYPLEDGILRPDARELGLTQEYPMSSDVLRSVLQGERMMALFAGLLGGEVRGYDFIWLRHQAPSHGVAPHCDLVFMGRGTPDVLTCWTPFGDIPVGGGGLMLLEDSHRKSVVRLADYLRQDVDTYCVNGPKALPDGGRAHLQHAHGPRRHRQRHERAAAVDRQPLPACRRARRRALGGRAERRAAGGSRHGGEARQDLLNQTNSGARSRRRVSSSICSSDGRCS
jgi:hypothetical protein